MNDVINHVRRESGVRAGEHWKGRAPRRLRRLPDRAGACAPGRDISERITLRLRGLAEVRQPTPYMRRKGLGVQPGLFTDARGTTFIPAMDTDGKTWAVQAIGANGDEVLIGRLTRAGCFHVVGGQWLLASADVVMITEDYASAATLTDLLHRPTVVAFGANNLRAVAIALRTAYPSKPIVVVGRDDRWCGGPALMQAVAAARMVGGRVLVPLFAPGEQESAPHRFVDFHDLANRSALGRAGAYRQARFMCEEALDDVRMRRHQRRWHEPGAARTRRQTWRA